MYTVVNDLTSVPNFAYLNSFAILRHRSSQKVKQYQFRPKRVKDALFWLVAHNHLYEDVMCSFPSHINWMSDQELDLESMDDIMLNDEELEELEGIDEGNDVSSPPPSTNTGARDGENEVLLMLPESMDDSETCTFFEAAHNKPIVDRGCHHEFVDPLTDLCFIGNVCFQPYFRMVVEDPVIVEICINIRSVYSQDECFSAGEPQVDEDFNSLVLSFLLLMPLMRGSESVEYRMLQVNLLRTAKTLLLSLTSEMSSITSTKKKEQYREVLN